MSNNPFNISTSPYGWEEEEGEDEETQSIRRMREVFDVEGDMEIIDHLEEQVYDGYTPTEETPLSAQSPQGGGNRKRAKRQVALIGQVQSQINLLIDELDRAHIYKED